MPIDCREVRPRNFPPRFSSGASRRLFFAIGLMASLALPATARDPVLRPVEITVAAERSRDDEAPSAIRLEVSPGNSATMNLPTADAQLAAPSPRAQVARPLSAPVPIRLPAINTSCQAGPGQHSQAILLTTFQEEANASIPQETLPAEELASPEPDADTEAASNFGLKPMSAMSIDIAPPQGEGGHPEDFAAARFERERIIDPAQDVGRDWALTDYRWEASMLCHAPLLFEQVNAERYGITYGCLQPLVSGAHFFATIPAVPYKVWANGHDQRQYALGYYRPGSYAEPQCYKPRISADAGLFEAGVILGLIYALP